MSGEPEFPPVRRVVTGHDAKGCARVALDGAASNARRSKSGGRSTLVWCTDRAPADIPADGGFEDMGARMLGTPPPRNGTRFAVNDIPPGRTGAMHRTDTVDYVIVLSGELEMRLDVGSVRLKPGDVVVQRGTQHAWINPGPEPARVAFVLVDAEPLGIGAPVTRGQKVG